jgi:hypothetical protein
MELKAVEECCFQIPQNMLDVRLTGRMHVDAHMWLTMKETIRTGTTIDYEEEDDGRG